MIKYVQNKISFILFSILLFACSGVEQTSTLSYKRDRNPVVLFKEGNNNNFIVNDSVDLGYLLDTLGIKQLCDSARWQLYCCSCVDTVSFNDCINGYIDHSDFTTMGELPLYLHAISKYKRYPTIKGFSNDYQLIFSPFDYVTWMKINADTNCYIFSNKSYYNLYFCLHYNANRPSIPIAFEIPGSRHKAVFCPVDSDISDMCLAQKIRKTMLNNAQPEIIAYVRANASRINPWFLNEAKKRGMFDSVKYSPAWVERSIAANKKKPKSCIDP